MSVTIPARLAQFTTEDVDTSAPVTLFDADDHTVAWVGSGRASTFRCNAYLVRTANEAWLIDPGAAGEFEATRERVASILPSEQVTRLIVHHQDPDLCGSLPAWLDHAPRARVHTTHRAAVLIEHYGIDPGRITLTDGGKEERAAELEFVMAPFLHSPASFTTYDPVSRFLFTGDIFGAIADADTWRLVTDDFTGYALAAMEMFHMNYMASNRATRNFLRNLGDRPLAALLPQHGSILTGRAIMEALGWLAELRCGVDLLPEAGPAGYPLPPQR